MPTLLIVDNETNVPDAFRESVATDELRVVTAATGAEALRWAQTCPLDAVIMNVRLPDMSGIEAFDRLRRIDVRVPVILVTADATTETAIETMKRGAFDYLIKPVDREQLRGVIAKALEVSRLQDAPTLLDSSDSSAAIDCMVGQSAAMQEVYKMIGRVAPEDVTVLILGESGTGKELVARSIYRHSKRNENPFVAINCAALPESLLESELFGYERGAFTGAERRRIGKFEQAHGGTIFLDELGDMSPGTQAKVLRVLHDGRFERVGGNETVDVSVRVIAATNQDLQAKIVAGQFRSDLFYRINGFSIRLPCLRERLEDLPLLIEHFLKLANQEVSNRATTLAPETLRLLQDYPWPGNLRELRSVLKYAVVHAVGEVITPDCLPQACRSGQAGNGLLACEEELSAVVHFARTLAQAGTSDIYRRVHSQVDRILLREVLREVSGNQVHASERLGISRTTLRSKLHSLGFDTEAARY